MVRLKSRYILFEVIYPPNLLIDSDSLSKRDIVLSHHKASPPEVSAKSIMQEIRRSLQTNFGDYGAGRVGSLLQVKYFSNNTSTGILRCLREDCDLLVAALVLINKINDVDGLIVNPVKISGTIKKIEQFSIRRSDKLLSLINKKQFPQATLINDFAAISDDENID